MFGQNGDHGRVVTKGSKKNIASESKIRTGMRCAKEKTVKAIIAKTDLAEVYLISVHKEI